MAKKKHEELINRWVQSEKFIKIRESLISSTNRLRKEFFAHHELKIPEYISNFYGSFDGKIWHSSETFVNTMRNIPRYDFDSFADDLGICKYEDSEGKTYWDLRGLCHDDMDLSFFKFTDVDFSASYANFFRFTYSELEDCKFSVMEIGSYSNTGMINTGCHFENVKFENTVFASTLTKNCVFEKCKFPRLASWSISDEGSLFSDCRFNKYLGPSKYLNTTFRNCKFAKKGFYHKLKCDDEVLGKFEGVRFVNCDFSKVEEEYMPHGDGFVIVDE